MLALVLDENGLEPLSHARRPQSQPRAGLVVEREGLERWQRLVVLSRGWDGVCVDRKVGLVHGKGPLREILIYFYRKHAAIKIRLASSDFH